MDTNHSRSIFVKADKKAHIDAKYNAFILLHLIYTAIVWKVNVCMSGKIQNSYPILHMPGKVCVCWRGMHVIERTVQTVKVIWIACPFLMHMSCLSSLMASTLAFEFEPSDSPSISPAATDHTVDDRQKLCHNKCHVIKILVRNNKYSI